MIVTLSKIFVIVNINKVIDKDIEKLEENTTLGEIDFYNKINKLFYIVKKVSYKNFSLNYKNTENIKINDTQDNLSINSLNALIYILNENEQNSKYYQKTYLFNI